MKTRSSNWINAITDYGRQFNNSVIFQSPLSGWERGKYTTGGVKVNTSDAQNGLRTINPIRLPSVSGKVNVKIKNMGTVYVYVYGTLNGSPTARISYHDNHTETNQFDSNTDIYIYVLDYSGGGFDMYFNDVAYDITGHIITSGDITQYALEAYNNADITITEQYSEEDNLTMGKAFTKELKTKIYEPMREASYNRASIKAECAIKLLDGTDEWTSQHMGIFYPSEVKTEDEYQTLDITAYDKMMKLDEPYQPNVSLPCSDKDILDDIDAQYGLGTVIGFSPKIYQTADNQYLNPTGMFTEEWGYYEEGVVNLNCSPRTPTSNKLQLGILPLDGNPFGYDDLPAGKKLFDCNIPLVAGHTYGIVERIENIPERAGDLQSAGFIPRLKSGSTTIATDFDEMDVLLSMLEGKNVLFTFEATQNQTLTQIEAGMYVYIILGTYGDAVSHISFEVVDLTLAYGAGNEPTDIDEYELEYPNYINYIANPQLEWVHAPIDKIYECTVSEMLGYLAGMQGKNCFFNCLENINFSWYSTAQTLTVDRKSQHEEGLSHNNETFTIRSITSGTEDDTITIGEGNGITFYNPYMTEDLLEEIYNKVNGLTYKVGEVEWFGDVALEPCDRLTIRNKDNTTSTFYNTKTEWDLSAGLSARTTSIGNNDAEVSFATENKGQLATIKTGLQEVQIRQSKLINKNDGVYTILEDDSKNPYGWECNDGQTPVRKVVRCNYEGIGCSKDGGEHYTNAITGDGIDASAVYTGTLAVGGVSNDVALLVKDQNGVDIGKWNKTQGLRAEKGVIGALNANFLEGEPSGWEINTDSINGLSSKTMGTDFYVRRAYLQPYNNTTREDGWIFSFQKSAEQYRYEPNNWLALFCVEGSGKVLCHEFAVGNHTIEDGVLYEEDSFYVDENGDVLSGRITASGIDTLYGDNEAQNGRWINGSLAETKTNIEKANNMLGIVNNTDIYSYNFITDIENGNTKKSYGVVIGDGYRTPDEIISISGNGIDTYSMVSVLWKAVQELSAEVEKLKGELEQ